ncbi:MAG: DJ-1/PfpI family protein [Bacteroidota bacterium]
MKRYCIYLLPLLLFEACQPSEPQSQAQQTESPVITAENHDEAMNQMFDTPTHQIRRIGILVYDGCNSLDVLGPRYVLGQIMGAKIQLVSLTPGNIKTVMGIEIVPDAIIDSVSQLDILVIPGGFRGTILGAYDDKLHEWIRMIDQNSVYTASVCTGCWILGATGLLKGKKATTNWYRAEEKLARYGASFVQERYVQDGKYWTSAGVTAGMDMSLAMVKDIMGEDYGQAVMLDMEYDPAPPFEGGSPAKTKAEVFQMMQAMYDMGVQPIVDSLENRVD